MLKQSRVSRRGFLACGAAAMATPYLVPASALGKDGAVPPSDRIPMGFCGIGTQGGGHLFGGAWTYLPGGYLARRDVQVVGVCDVQHHRADDAKKRVEQFYAQQSGKGSYKACKAYYDIRDMLASDDIDAVLIAASYWAQGVMAGMAARAGKDVYCEKPTAIAIRWGRAIAESVRANDRVFQAGTQQRLGIRRPLSIAPYAWSAAARSARLQRVYAEQAGGGFSMPGPGRRTPEKRRQECQLGGLRRPAAVVQLQRRNPRPEIRLGRHQLGPAPLRHRAMGHWRRRHRADPKFAWKATCPSTPMPTAWWFTAVRRRAKSGRKAAFVSSARGGRHLGRSFHLQVRSAGNRQGERVTPVVPGVYHSTSHGGNFLECVRTRQRTIADIETAHRANSVLLLGGIAGHLKRTLKWDPVQGDLPRRRRGQPLALAGSARSVEGLNISCHQATGVPRQNHLHNLP